MHSETSFISFLDFKFVNFFIFKSSLLPLSSLCSVLSVTLHDPYCLMAFIFMVFLIAFVFMIFIIVFILMMFLIVFISIMFLIVFKCISFSLPWSLLSLSLSLWWFFVCFYLYHVSYILRLHLYHVPNCLVFIFLVLNSLILFICTCIFCASCTFFCG